MKREIVLNFWKRICLWLTLAAILIKIVVTFAMTITNVSITIAGLFTGTCVFGATLYIEKKINNAMQWHQINDQWWISSVLQKKKYRWWRLSSANWIWTIFFIKTVRTLWVTVTTNIRWMTLTIATYFVGSTGLWWCCKNIHKNTVKQRWKCIILANFKCSFLVCIRDYKRGIWICAWCAWQNELATTHKIIV